VLGRPADSGGAAGFLQFMAQAERNSHSTVANAFVKNDEYRANLISQTFLKLLGRAAGAGDINIFLPLLRQPSAGPGSASPDEQFFAALAGSGEYFFRQTDPANGLHTNAQWVNSLYVNFLGRQADPGGLSGLLTNLLTGYQPQRLAVSTTIVNSTEYRQDLVIKLFVTYLRRQPSPQELAARVAQLAGGAHDEDLINVLVSSPEYFNNPTGKGGAGDNSIWLNQVYLDLLGRSTSNDPGAANFLQQLNAGKLTRAQIATIILGSGEYRAHLVTGLYQTLLGRTPSGSELNLWLAAIAKGTTDEQIIENLVASNEYSLRQLDPARLPSIFP